MEQIGYYKRLLGDQRYSLKRFYFRRDVLNHFIDDPHYTVSAQSIHVRSMADLDLHGGMQQYVNAIDRDGNVCIMALLSHLCQLRANEQDIFKGYEIVQGGMISIYDHNSIIHAGLPLEKSDPYGYLLELISKINEIVLPRKLFKLDNSNEIYSSKEFLPLTFNSKKKYLKFVTALNNITADNIMSSFFPNRIPKTDSNGKELGKLQRLEKYLIFSGVDNHVIKLIIDPLKRIRKVRSVDIHKVQTDTAESDYYLEQEKILYLANLSLRRLLLHLGKINISKKYTLHKRLRKPFRSIFDPLNFPELLCRKCFGNQT